MKFKAFLDGKNITQEKYEAMTDAEKAQLFTEYMEAAYDEVKAMAAANVSKEGFNELFKAQIEAHYKDQLTPEQIKAKVEEMEEKVAELIDKETEDLPAGTIKQAVKAALMKNVELLSEMKEDPDSKLQITIKAAGAMTFGTNTTGRVGRVEREAGIVGELRRTPMLLDITNTSGTNASMYVWIEKTGTDGGVEMVAEGAVKPQGDFDLIEYSQKPKKEALIITISKEMLDDIDDMARTVEEEIYELIRLFTEDIVLNGDGIGNNIEGLDANATPYVAGSFANTVEAANEFDALRTAINQVELNYDFPTYILMHPTDATKMELVKDATTSQYVMPPFASIDGTIIKGLPVRTSTVLTEGEAYVGNFNRFKVKVREDIVMDMGYRGTAGDWEKNMVSFLGEMRLFAFIPANHYGSIVKVDLDVAKALLDPSVADA